MKLKTYSKVWQSHLTSFLCVLTLLSSFHFEFCPIYPLNFKIWKSPQIQNFKFLFVQIQVEVDQRTLPSRWARNTSESHELAAVAVEERRQLRSWNLFCQSGRCLFSSRVCVWGIIRIGVESDAGKLTPESDIAVNWRKTDSVPEAVVVEGQFADLLEELLGLSAPESAATRAVTAPVITADIERVFQLVWNCLVRSRWAYHGY